MNRAFDLTDRPKKVWFQTYGCQMNEHDSEKMQDLLLQAGYLLAESQQAADIVLINTCSVRENPENKVYSFLGRLRDLKANKPELIVGVAGCVAQQEKERIFQAEPLVDLVFGPDQILAVVELLARAGSEKVLATDWSKQAKKVQSFMPPLTEDFVPFKNSATASIAITKGCDNFCSFCIVPFTRGRLSSRPPAEILADAKLLGQQGKKEILLLGQNVNSYQVGDYGFYELLSDLGKIPTIRRLRFISPHPKDWNQALSDLMAGQENLCPSLHLPFQSGSSRILELMRRDHNIQGYIEKVRYTQQKVANLALSTDVIVGFPSESEEDFEATLDVLENLRFFTVYAFKYSPRPGTKAEKMEDDVPRETKERRLQILLEHQAKITATILQSFLGTEQEVLIEESPKPGFYTGRNPQNIRIWVAAENLTCGAFYKVRPISHGKTSLNAELIGN